MGMHVFDDSSLCSILSSLIIRKKSIQVNIGEEKCELMKQNASKREPTLRNGILYKKGCPILFSVVVVIETLL